MAANDEQNMQILIDQIKSIRAQIETYNIETKLADLADNSNDLSIHLENTKILTGHFGKIYAMHWGSDSRHLASASQDGKLIVWDGQTTNKRHMINLRSSWVMTCAYSPSMNFVACGGLDNLCSIYQMDFNVAETNERPLHELSRHDGYLSCCRFLDDQTIITSSGDGSCILWDIEQASVHMIFQDHEADVMSVATKKNDRSIFVSGSCDQRAKIWDVRVGDKCVQDFLGHTSDINSVQWFPDEYCFGSGSDDSTVRLFDLRAYGELNRYKHDDIKCGATSIDFSKSGKYLFCGYDDRPYCAVWNAIKATRHQELTKSATRVSCLGVPDSGYCLCTGSWDNNLMIWAAT